MVTTGAERFSLSVSGGPVNLKAEATSAFARKPRCLLCIVEDIYRDRLFRSGKASDECLMTDMEPRARNKLNSDGDYL